MFISLLSRGRLGRIQGHSVLPSGPFSSNSVTRTIDPNRQQSALRTQCQRRHAMRICDQRIRTEWPWAIVSERAQLDVMRKERSACPAINNTITPTDDFCALSENLIASASVGFTFYRGKPDDDGLIFESRVDYAGGFCSIGNNAVFHCDLPETDEASVKQRKSALAASIMACSNLGVKSQLNSERVYRYGSSETSSILFPRKAQVDLRSDYRKPTASSPNGRSSLGLDISASSATSVQ